MDFSASIDQVQRALARTTLPATPIVVLTKDRPFDLAGREVPAGFGEKLDAAWRRAQRQLAASIAHVPLTVVETSHNISIERPDVVIDAIRRVVEAVRSGRKTVTQEQGAFADSLARLRFAADGSRFSQARPPSRGLLGLDNP